MTEPEGNDIEVFIPGVLRGSFETWLFRMSLELFPIPGGDPRLLSYGIRRKD